VFGVKLRQLANYVAIGKRAKPPELPPLDSPEEMAAWWGRMRAAGHLKQQCPRRFLALAAARPLDSGEKGIDFERYQQIVRELQEVRNILGRLLSLAEKDHHPKRPPPMTVRRASEYLGVPISAIRDYCRRGLITFSKSSPRKWLLDGNSVETFIERTS
jgi:hypothetical protein